MGRENGEARDNMPRSRESELRLRDDNNGSSALPSLTALFTDIADAIRAKTSGSDPLSPSDMGNAIRDIWHVAHQSAPEPNLPAVFQDIADALRSCGATGTMSALQMPLTVAGMDTPEPTRVTYTQASGLSDWSGDVVGEVAGTQLAPYYTTQIPNAQYIETIEFGELATSIGTYAFKGCTNLTTVDIPSWITSIGNQAFYDNTSLTDIDIPSTVTNIGSFAFRNCVSLEEIELPSSLTTFGRGAMHTCSALTSIAIPAGVGAIGLQTFYGCSSCVLFDFRAKQSVPTLANVNAFTGTPVDKKIVVPDALFSSWTSASNWSSSTNYIASSIINATDYECHIEVGGLDQSGGFTGRTAYCTCLRNCKLSTADSWSITSGSEYATINQNGRLDILDGADSSSVTISCSSGNLVRTKTISVTYGSQLEIECEDILRGSSATLAARYNQSRVFPTWSVTAGSSNATISSDGTLTILQSGSVTVQADYDGNTATKDLVLVYNANQSSQTIVGRDGSVTTQTSTVVQNQDGTTTTSSTSTTTAADGSHSSTTTSTVTALDGSSTSTSTTQNQDGTSSQTQSTTTAPGQDGSTSTSSTTTFYDGNGASMGTRSASRTDNSDGSSTSTATDYNASGDPTGTVNESVDSSGNASTQNIGYDEGGNQVVTGYSIDTSDNPSGEKLFNQDGVNTQFYGFDSVEGFTMSLHFTIDFTDQPSGQDQNHHNILTMKRADPSPWYGFQLRQSNTTKTIQLGTQFETGSNTNTSITPHSPNWIVLNQIAEFDIRVTYDPTLTTGRFVCREMLTDTTVFTSNYLFPDLPELRYLTVCLGYALDSNGDPYRYSKVNVLNFSLEKIEPPLQVPTMSFSENFIYMSCPTLNAEIHYRVGTTGQFQRYSSPVEISADSTVYAYSKRGDETSATVSQSFQYDDGIEEPVIVCDGEFVEITCSTPSADIFYRVGTSGQFQLYDQPFEINATVTVQAYSTVDNKQSETVSETCTYVQAVLADPVISCSDNLVEITCSTPRSAIYCRVGDSGQFAAYDGPFQIVEDVTVYAYSTHGNQTSQTVSEECTYSYGHDYSQDYLTFRAKTAGTINWKAFGSLTKEIQYSVNNGSWTSLTSTSGGATISVSAGDVVRFKGSNATYATSKSAYSGFEGGTATYDIEGNIMSLLYGDDFASNTALTNSTYQFCSIFKKAPVVSAKNLVLPATTLKGYCYRAMFSYATTLEEAPELPATTLAQGCYWYMFEQCSIAKAPVLPATTLATECYGHMFSGCAVLSEIQCFATTGFGNSKCLEGWVDGVAGSGVFCKSSSATNWTVGVGGIPSGWTTCDDFLLHPPVVSFDGDTIELTCPTAGAAIHYRLGQQGAFLAYSQPISILEDVVVEAYATHGQYTSPTVSQSCVYVQETPFQASNKDLPTWRHGGSTVATPYSVNRIDGQSANYAKGTFAFETDVTLHSSQPTYLWFQHADQSADIYVDNVKVETHWGGYNAFFSDISNYAHRGTNNIKVVLCNTTRNSLAPCSGDFNFNATLGNVKLFSSPCLPAMKYGYDGFHITSTVSSSSATVNVKPTVPSGATLVCTIDDGTYTWSDTKASNGEEQTFTTTISGNYLHLWNGKSDPHLYTVTLEIYKDNELYHRYQRPYGLRYYSYVVNQTVDGQTYTGFLLNGHPYQLRGVCMHDDLVNKANALNATDYDQEFAIIQELGCNFIRLAHYPHPKEVYDRCDQLGIIVQTEVPCVNRLRSSQPEDYYTHLTTQYTEMVQQHFNHPCICFWGLSNETTTDDQTFAKAKVEGYCSLIKSIDAERLVGYVMSHSYTNPSAYYGDPNVDWFGCNLYVGWYIDQTTNDPTTHINTRLANTTQRLGKPLAISEYGCGGTQHCHSDDFMTTTTPGNYERHDIEYMMWLHEGHLAALRNYPQLLFTGEWQLFDIAVSGRNEGYTECLDGTTTSTNDDLRRLNNKGLVERDHVTKKDPFYLYKAEWNPTPFVHICCKDYTKTTDRVLKCYANDGNSLSLYDGSDNLIETVQVTDHIATFTARNYTTGVTYKVSGSTTYDTVTF